MVRLWTSLACCFLPLWVLGQLNSNYWSHQYGTKGQLLNGAVIANVDDETAIFYNPGAYALYDHTGVSLSLVTPAYNYIRTSEFLGDNTSFSDRSFGFAPGLVAASIKPFDTNRLIIGLAAFSRYKSNISYSDRDSRSLNSEEFFLGELNFERRINERWIGTAISFQISNDLSIGVSQFVTFRSESLQLGFKKDVLSKNDPEQVIQGWKSNSSYDFSINGGFRSKFGLVWKPGKIAFGLTYTLPINSWLFSNAKYTIDDRKVRDVSSLEVISNYREIDIEQFKTPSSLGFGVSFTSGKTEVSISAEYFTATDPHLLIDDVDDPFDGQSSTPAENKFQVSQASEEVLNFAIGCKKPLKGTLAWYYGFRTDLSAQSLLRIGDDIAFLALTPDIFHVSSGISSEVWENHFSIGFDYGFGYKSGGQQLTNISSINPEDLFTFGGDAVVDTYSHQLSVFVTYDF